MTKLKVSLFTALMAIIVFILAIPIYGAETEIAPDSARTNAVYLYNVTTGEVLFDKNSDKKISPASTVKLMTALVAYNNIKSIDEYVIITEKMLGNIETNTMKLQIGEQIKIRDLFIGLVCGGYNDAANALAVIAGDSVEFFVDMMNDQAKELAMENTMYVDPTGIDDSAQTTAHDTMLVAKEFRNHSFLLDSSSLPSYNVPATNMSNIRTMYNRNAMLSNYTGSKYLNSSAEGMNSGMTGGGGYCVVTSTSCDDMVYICVVMGGEYDSDNNTIYSYVVANELIYYVINNLGYRVIFNAGDEIGTLPVIGGNLKVENVRVVVGSDIKVYLPADYTSSGKLSSSFIYYKNELVAPIKKGTCVGYVVVSYGDDIVAVADMVTAEDVERDGFMYGLYAMRTFITSRVFWACIIAFIILFLIYILINTKRKTTRRRRKNINMYNKY